MEASKRRCPKVAIGDCVSIEAMYFGNTYAMKVGFERMYGRVLEISPNGYFSVRWDFDKVVSQHITLQKVRMEDRNTPMQCAADETAGQGSSTEASTAHAFLVESEVNLNDVDEGLQYVLMSGSLRCFIANMISTESGAIVHNKELLESQRKFLIVDVLDTTWEGFDEDIHTAGSFLAWNLEDAAIIVEKEVEEDSKKKKKRKFELKVNMKGFEIDEEGEQEEEENKENEEDESSETDEDTKKVIGQWRRKRKKLNKRNTEKKKKKKTQKRGSKKAVKETEVHMKEKEQEKTTVDLSNRRKKSLGNSNATRGAKKRKVGKDKEKEDSDVISSSDSGESEEEDKDEKKRQDKLKEQQAAWTKGGWTINPCTSHPFGPKLHLANYEMLDEMAFLFHFIPVKYIKDVLLPATNDYGLKNVPGFKKITFEEFIIFLGLVYSMEVIKLPERSMYWEDHKSNLFHNSEFGKHMSRNRFNEILAYLQFSFAEDKTTQILDFLDAVNEHLDEAVSAGQFVCVDESMIKAFHRHLPGKIKIKRKPRPIGNEIKDLSDASSMIVLRMELYEGKDQMSTKEHVQEHGATCATTLRLVEPIKGTGRIVVGDAWFGSVLTVKELMKIGLYAIMLVKMAHRNYPKELLNSHQISRGEWVAYTREVENVNIMACSFMDLKKKQFISTCGTIIAGTPRSTKHHGDVNRPKVAETYLKYADSIDKHNSFRTGSLGLEDVLHTHSPHLRQFFGVLGFLMTNAFLGYRFFKPDQLNVKHLKFKMSLAEKMVHFKESETPTTYLRIRSPDMSSSSALAAADVHEFEKLPYQKPCYYCRHGYTDTARIKTTFKCTTCNIPIHRPSFVHRRKDGSSKVLKCWQLHLIHGKPEYRRSSSSK